MKATILNREESAYAMNLELPRLKLQFAGTVVRSQVLVQNFDMACLLVLKSSEECTFLSANVRPIVRAIRSQ